MGPGFSFVESADGSTSKAKGAAKQCFRCGERRSVVDWRIDSPEGRGPIPSPAMTQASRRRLENAAREAAKASYAPYSKFAVGAAVLTASGEIFSGCNVENASYGLAICAERTAVFAAVTAGQRVIKAVAVHTSTASPTMPCGACRQVINEFGPDATVIGVCDSRRRTTTTLRALQPDAFGPGILLG